MDTDDRAFKTRLEAACRIESDSRNFVIYTNDVQDLIRNAATGIDRDADATVDVESLVRRLHERWAMYQRTSTDAHPTQSAHPQTDDHDAQTEAFLGAVTSSVADQLVSLTSHRQPWEAQVAGEDEDLDALPVPSTRLTAAASRPAPLSEADGWGWDEEDELGTPQEDGAAVQDDEASRPPIPRWTRLSLDERTAVSLPTLLYRRWSTAVQLMDTLVEHTMATERSFETRRALRTLIRTDLYTCMLLEAQRHASCGVLAARDGTEMEGRPQRSQLVRARLACLHVHTHLWLACECRRAATPALAQLANAAFATTLGHVADRTVEAAMAWGTRYLVTAASRSTSRDTGAIDSMGALRALLADMREAFDIPASLLGTEEGQRPDAPSLWQVLVVPWLSNVLLPLAQQLLTPDSALGRLWQRTELEERRAASEQGLEQQSAAISMRAHLLQLLDVFEEELGVVTTRQVTAYGTLREMATVDYGAAASLAPFSR